MKKPLLCISLVLVMLFTSFTTAFAEAFKDETIYVNLKNDGNVSDIKVVNHVHGFDDSDYFIDYGKYSDIKNLSNDAKPEIKDDTVKWPTSLLKQGDLYYEGTINKELPLNFEIKYFLDGSEIKAEDLAGKSGDLKINIKVKENFKDKKNKPAFLTQIQLSLDLDKFSDINAKNATSAIVGKKMNINFIYLPFGDGDFTLEAKGKNIELDPIVISIVSSSNGIPEEIKKKGNEFSSGINKMSDAGDKLEGGSKDIVDGTVKLKGGLSGLNSGLYKVYEGSNEVTLNSKKIYGGFSQFDSGLLDFKNKSSELSDGVKNIDEGLNSLSKESSSIKEGLYGLNEGTSKLNAGLGNVSAGMSELDKEHEDLCKLAKLLSSSSDPQVKMLAQGVLEEGKAIKSLDGALKESSKATGTISQNINNVYLGYDKYNEGLKSTTLGMNKLNTEMSILPEKINEMYSGHTKLTYGLKNMTSGYESMKDAYYKAYEGTKEIPSEVDKLINGEKQLQSGISSLNNEGIKKLKTSADQILNTEFLKVNNAKAYTSFADEERNKNSTCQFVMKTPSIKIKKEPKADNTAPEENKSFFQKLIDLFKK